MRKIYGKFILGVSKIINGILEFLIIIVSAIVGILSTIGSGLLSLTLMGGCVILGSLPILIIFFLNPYVIGAVLTAILLFGVIPLLGTSFVSWLKYRQYVTVEYLTNYSKYLLGEDGSYQTYGHFQNEYQRKQQEQFQREQEARRQQEQAFWEEQFKNWYQQQNTGGYQSRNYYQNGGYQYQGSQNTYVDPRHDFIEKYKQSCDLLEIPYTADKYQVKLAYRKMAKKYHPDLNKDGNATEMFQKVNAAFEFLSDENIERYKGLSK